MVTGLVVELKGNQLEEAIFINLAFMIMFSQTIKLLEVVSLCAANPNWSWQTPQAPFSCPSSIVCRQEGVSSELCA